jgi:hypothetical protein
VQFGTVSPSTIQAPVPKLWNMRPSRQCTSPFIPPSSPSPMIIAILGALALRSLPDGAPIIPVDATPQESGIACQQFRTLSSILYSCFLTMFACTWTAVHPNLPGPSDGRIRIFGRKMWLVLVTLLAPEYILFWALMQRNAAKRLLAAAKQGPPALLNSYPHS